MREKLIELLIDLDMLSCGKTRRCDIERRADYLLENGVIIPKYKVGDIVWYITGIHKTIIKSAIVEEIIINCNGVSDLFVTSDAASFENSVEIFYPTREEAEKALERSKQ